MMRGTTYFRFFLVFCFVLTGFLCGTQSVAADAKTILWVDSYHPGFEWIDGVERGIRESLTGTQVDLQILRMDTKRHKDEPFKVAAGEKAYEAVQAIKPDLIIASDDNAQQYFVVPYLKGGDIPVVFCGVNWDASAYGYPWQNVTGMIEIEPVDALIRHFHTVAQKQTVGYLSEDTLTTNRVYPVYNNKFFGGKLKKYLVKDFSQFKQAFLQAQKEVGALIIGNYAGIEGWDPDEAKRFLLEHIAVPTGSFDTYMSEYVIYTVSKVPYEQGAWAAKSALSILAGTPVSSIPVTYNEQADLIVNLEMATALGITIPVSTLKAAKVIGQKALEGR